jgi:DNA repair exonuclease SbcCD ATPase subunit
MADLDNQLKKKCTESEKITLMLDQVRAKSERIHELEAQFARIERQSTNERQTYEKQAHENWLQARKNERELKDARQELVTVKERLADAEASVKALQSENQLLKQQQQQNLYKFPAGYYMNSPNLNRFVYSIMYYLKKKTISESIYFTIRIQFKVWKRYDYNQCY